MADVADLFFIINRGVSVRQYAAKVFFQLIARLGKNYIFVTGKSLSFLRDVLWISKLVQCGKKELVDSKAITPEKPLSTGTYSSLGREMVIHHLFSISYLT